MATAEAPELPGDLHAEQGVLGAMLLSEDAAVLAADMLTIEDFYRQAHQFIFSAAVSALEGDNPCDLLTVGNELKGRGQLEEVGGHEYLLAIMQCVPAVEHLERYASIIREQTNRRRLIDLTRAAESRAFNNDSFHDVMTWTLDQMLRLADSDDACGGLKFCNWKDLDAYYGQIEWVWEGWLPRGMVSILAAEPGLGKTGCAMGLAGIVTAGGADWPDGAPGPTTPERVVFIETENRTHLLMERIRAWSLDGFEVVRQLPAEGRAVVDIASPTQQRAMAEAIKRTGARLLIIDSLSAGHTLEENSDDMKRLLLDLCRLAAETNVALLAIHHLRKRGKAEPLGVSLDRLRGSSTIAQLAVVTLTLERPDRDLPNLVLRQIKNNVAPEQDAIGLEITSGGIRWSSDVPDEPDESERRERGTAEAAEEFLARSLADGPCRTAELVEEAAGMGIRRTTLYEAMRRMGLARPQWGVVALPEAPPSCAVPDASGEGPHERTCPVVQGHASEVGPAVDVGVPLAPNPTPHTPASPPPEPSLGPDFAALAERAFPAREYPSGGTNKPPAGDAPEADEPEPPVATRVVHGAGRVPITMRVP